MRRRGMSTMAIVAIVLLVLVVIGAVIWFANQTDPPPQAGPQKVPPDAAFQLTRAALAATESLDTAAATRHWDQVLQQRPQDPDALRNAALHQVSAIQQLSARLYDGSLTPQEKMVFAERLSTGIAAARAAITRYEQYANQPQLVAWMRAIVDIEQANQLPEARQQPARIAAFLKLADQIEASEKPLILVGPLSELAAILDDPADGLPEPVAERYPAVLRLASDKHPRNLFVAMETLGRLLAARDPRAAQWAERVEELSRPLAGLLERYAKAERGFVEEQTETIRTAVSDDNWAAAEVPAFQLRNVLTSTEIMRTDRRRANPNALDLLSFDGLRELAAAWAEQNAIDVAAAPLQFTLQSDQAAIASMSFATADVDLDGRIDILSVFEGQLSLYRHQAAQWESFASAPIAADSQGVVVTDLFMVDASEPSRIRKPPSTAISETESVAASKGHETYPSAVVFGPSGIEIFRIDGRENLGADQRLLPPAAATGLEDVRGVIDVQSGDLDADGDLDLVVATSDEGLRLWINRGNMTFFEVTQHSSLAPADDPVTAMNIGDFDRDLDLDILLTHGRSGRVAVLENLLHLQFRWRAIEAIEPLSDPSLVTLEEIDGDVSWDIVAAGSQGASVAFTNTVDAGQVDVTETIRIEQPASAAVVADFNNDSWLDWLAIGPTTSTVHTLGPWGQRPHELVAELPAASSQLAAADLDNDGRLDLVGIVDGQLWTALNTTAATGHYLDVRFRGKNDNNENSGRINHYGIGTVLEMRFGPHYRAQVITERTTHFGIDDYEAVDMMRAILPNGITQNTVSPPIDTVFNEEQTLKGSCPYLYAWDGERFVFVTDCLWAAPLGLQLASGVIAPDRPWEYLKVPGEFVAPRDGAYELRITEELWEAAYFDHVQLTAVDHPADVEIFTNEKVGPAAIAQRELFAFDPQSLLPVTAASDTRGRDVAATLAADDRDFVQGFDYRLRQGLCPPHWIDLDLGSVKADDKVLLVLTGWILPTDTSLNIQIDQNPALPAVQPPAVLVPDGDVPGGDQWKMAIPFMGFPGGKTKTIVVDLSGHLNVDDPRVRIQTSAQIYWDRAAVAINPPEQPVEQHALTLLSAELTAHGFSRRIDNGTGHPETYDYDDAETTPRWPPLRGAITAHGDVLPLLEQWDDSMIVMGAGDEIRLRFSLPESPLPAGWKRDFVLHSVGWDKDADLNTITGQQFGPLPFRSMTAYPPGPEQLEQAHEVWQKNARHLTRQQRFRSFWQRN